MKESPVIKVLQLVFHMLGLSFLPTVVLGRRERRRVELLVFQHVAKSPLGTRKFQFVALFGLKYGIAMPKIKIDVCSNLPIFFSYF